MSEYRKIGCSGWWESKEGKRYFVIGVHDRSLAWIFDSPDDVEGEIVDIDRAGKFKYLTYCTSWNWKPERENKEIEFPEWILPQYNWVVVNASSRVVISIERPLKQTDHGYWFCGADDVYLSEFSDVSWVPCLDNWEDAIWQRKTK